MSSKRLIVGLGNPGRKYEHTRHNIGFRVIDELAARHRLGTGRSEKRALTFSGHIGGIPIKLAKPMTYMNRSGESVRQLMDFYDIALSNLLVVHDDLDTPFGIIRLRQAGGHGGQNGLRSIIQHLGSKDFVRLRFGIGRPPGKMDPVNYVLQPFKGDDAIRADELAARAVDAVEVCLREGIEAAMTRFNGEAGAAPRAPQPRDLEAQLTIARRAHELAPADHKPLLKLIALQKKLGHIDDAVANHLKLAGIYKSAGKGEEALAEMVKAVSIRPSMVAEQRAIAEGYLAQNNRKRAVNRYLIIAQHFCQSDDQAAALDEVERALTINPQHPKALDMRRSLKQMLTSTKS